MDISFCKVDMPLDNSSMVIKWCFQLTVNDENLNETFILAGPDSVSDCSPELMDVMCLYWILVRLFQLMEVVGLLWESDVPRVLDLMSHAAYGSLVPPMQVRYHLAANCPQEIDPIILRERLAAAHGHHLMVILHFMEQETFSGFVRIANVLLVEKWPIIERPFARTELWLVRGNMSLLPSKTFQLRTAFKMLAGQVHCGMGIWDGDGRTYACEPTVA
jgi:hypothetical protein